MEGGKFRVAPSGERKQQLVEWLFALRAELREAEARAMRAEESARPAASTSVRPHVSRTPPPNANGMGKGSGGESQSASSPSGFHPERGAPPCASL